MTDRLSLIKARHAEAGGGNGDFEWLIAEVERLRAAIHKHFEPHPAINGISWACCDPDLMDAVREA